MRRRRRGEMQPAIVWPTIVYDDAWAAKAELVLARAAVVNAEAHDCLMQIDLDRVITETRHPR